MVAVAMDADLGNLHADRHMGCWRQDPADRPSPAEHRCPLVRRWDEAADICTELLAIPGRLACESALPAADSGHIRGRRGEPGDAELLDRAAALAAGIVSPKISLAQVSGGAGGVALGVGPA